MDETRPTTGRRGAAGAIAGRLYGARWTLVAAAAAIACATWLAGELAEAAWAFAAVLVAIVAAVAALAPPGAPADRGTGRTGPVAPPSVDGLSAQRLADAVSDPLLVLDGAGIVVHANQAARTTFGQVLVGVDFHLRFRTPEMHALLRDMILPNAESRTIDHAERLPIERLYRVTATPVGAGTGLFVMVFKDQSELRRIDRMRADFIANASHELRTPLASIAGFVETLRGPARNDPEARARFLDIMQAQTGRMARLIDDLLSLSRLEMKPFVAPGERADVVRVLGAVADALGHLASDAGVAIERELPSEPMVVAGNRDELTQVFENLLENAIKYGRSGKRVVLSVQRGQGGPHPEIEVTVRDFGPGIPSEHIPRVTERFYRVDAGADQAQKGTGLGLAIVKHILTRHHARLTIRSEEGAGAAFTVHLPAG